LDAGKISVNLYILGGFRFDFSGPKAGFGKDFHRFFRIISKVIGESKMLKLNIATVSF
jgi:hypothetical protein